MTEEFLHFIWKFQLFETSELRTLASEELTILENGTHNTDAGPDFSEAKIKIGNTLWAGNIEIHIKSSDWYKHNHQNDEAYDNVILHVVYENDQKTTTTGGETIPTLELKNRLKSNYFNSYKKLLSSRGWIPCHNQISGVDSFYISQWLNRLLISRLERKTKTVRERLIKNGNDWNETFYQTLAGNFGFKLNAPPFERVAIQTPLKILAKHKTDLFQIEALLFGQSGILEDEFKEEYPQKLQKEYQFLKTKYSLSSIKKQEWKFLRLRPPNFPTIRLAQFAALVFSSTHLFSKILETTTIEQLKKLFDCKVSEYWENHFVFDKPSKKSPKTLGEKSIEILLINTVIPFIFIYGKMQDKQEFQDRAIRFLEKIPPESNAIINQWKKLGVESKSAYESQALLELKNEFCAVKKCLSCNIGLKLLKPL